jgi:hypothetical protein
MNPVVPPNSSVNIRPVQYRDLEVVERLYVEGLEADNISCSIDPDRPLKRKQLRSWQGALRAMGWLLNPLQYMFCASVTQHEPKIQGMIRVSPFNRTRTTWRVDQVAIAEDRLTAMASKAPGDAAVPVAAELKPLLSGVGSQLLRYCFEKIWEARTWLLEVNIHDKALLALYRQNGFQPLAHITYWLLTPAQLQEIADREPDLPNLLPVSNADAQLLYQLDTASMPPLVRQVFDRHILDFKTSLWGSLLDGLKNWLTHTEVVSGYVFEPQRKAAIGYFQLRLCRDGGEPHQAQLTVHPAYTWLYPELMSQMARITQDLPAQSLQIASSDYHPEREEYLERIGATRIAHTLMMSRSVWHKVREAKAGALEGLQLAEVLQGLKPARKPVPSRISLLRSTPNPAPSEPPEPNPVPRQPASTEPAERNSKHLLNLPISSDFSDPPQEGPCC